MAVHQRTWVWFWLTTIAIGFMTYSLLILTLSVQPTQNPNTQSNPVKGTNLTDDLFTLHPELHVSREPRTIGLHWNITNAPHRPDGVLRDALYLINGQFPGPIIEARSGDELQVTVVNNVANDTSDGISIHWHGILMKGFNEMDGAVGVTQCTINQGESFTYKFKISPEQHGTFWYHAHSAVKRADGLYGGLVVHKPASKNSESDASLHNYSGEKLLLISDWYHFPASQVISEYKDFLSFAAEPVADSILINGVGTYNCSKARPGKPVDCLETNTPPPVIQIPSNGRENTRLRIVNTGSAAGFSLELTNAAIKLITVDGGGKVSNSTPWTSTLGVVYPGERIDLLLASNSTQSQQKNQRHDSESSGSNLAIILDPELMPIMNPALTRIHTYPLSWSHSHSPSTSVMNRDDAKDFVKTFDLSTAQGDSLSEPLPQNSTEISVLYTTLGPNSYKDDAPWGELNHTSFVWKDANTKPLLAMDMDAWETATEQANPFRHFKVPWFESGQKWVELVINNVDEKGHPFHLHGYEFYVVSSELQTQFGKPYNPYDEAQRTGAQKLSNFATPLRKDTVYIRAQGYVVIMLRLDNPGLWLLHCHVLWHQAVGMGIVLQIGNITEETARRAGESCIS